MVQGSFVLQCSVNFGKILKSIIKTVFRLGKRDSHVGKTTIHKAIVCFCALCLVSCFGITTQNQTLLNHKRSRNLNPTVKAIGFIKLTIGPKLC